MHARFTTALGMSVTDELEDDIGIVTGILVHPDLAKVEGFFISVSSFMHRKELFLPVSGILHFGTRIRVRHSDAVAPVEDVMRLAPLLEDNRTVIGQRIVTENGSYIGRCCDIQFETKAFQLEWLFPKKLFRWRRPISRREILQIKNDIIIKDPNGLQTVNATDVVMQTLEPLVGPSVTRTINK